jgi:hypothetical protein
MSGVDIVGSLLRAFEPLIAIVPIENIKAGVLPDGIPLPAILVASVSLVDLQMLKREPMVRSTERVAVAVRAASHRDREAIIRLIPTCCAGRTGEIGGSLRVSILTAGTGPDVIGPANSFEKTQDLRVSFEAPV